MRVVTGGRDFGLVSCSGAGVCLRFDEKSGMDLGPFFFIIAPQERVGARPHMGSLVHSDQDARRVTLVQGAATDDDARRATPLRRACPTD